MPSLILDFSQVKYIDSSGLSAILTGHRLWKDQGAFVVAGELHPMVKRLIEISKLDAILHIVPTLNEGIQLVKSHPEESR